MPADHLAWLFSLEQFGIKLGLQNITTILDALDRPDRSFRAVHIAGTNGKGSVTAMVAAALQHAGFRTGRYTSPHLVDLRERFVIDGAPVATEPFDSALARIRAVIKRLLAGNALQAPPTFFETTTALAFEVFRRAGVEIAAAEVGLGGRLDATNVLQPVVAAITSIAFDHEKHLGSTLGAIAGEKAGILKPSTPVVTGPLEPEARKVISDAAQRVGAPVIDADAEVRRQRVPSPDPWGPTTVRMATPVRDYGEMVVGLRGAHQIHNAAVAVRILELLGEMGVGVPPESIVNGLAFSGWPGRLERRRLPDGREALLDAAHNPEGAAALAAFLRETGSRPPLVFAAMRDKDIRSMLVRLLPVCGRLVATRASNPRCEDPETVAALAAGIDDAVPVTAEADIDRALETAWRSSPLVVIAGSTFLLGDVMNRLGWS